MPEQSTAWLFYKKDFQKKKKSDMVRIIGYSEFILGKLVGRIYNLKFFQELQA
jgi:hypothetical protein